jgi:hypothetical protein
MFSGKSEETQLLLKKLPGGLIRWGMLLLLILVVVLFYCLSFIKFEHKTFLQIIYETIAS